MERKNHVEEEPVPENKHVTTHERDMGDGRVEVTRQVYKFNADGTLHHEKTSSIYEPPDDGHHGGTQSASSGAKSAKKKRSSSGVAAGRSDPEWCLIGSGHFGRIRSIRTRSYARLPR